MKFMLPLRACKAFVVVMLVVLSVGCTTPTSKTIQAWHAIDGLLAEAPSNGGRVDFSQINAFAWDALYVVGPFTAHEQIEAALGFAWDEEETVAIGRRDDINLLVFTHNGAVVASLELRRGEVDFSLASGVERFTPQTATFQAQTTPEGAILLTPLVP